MAYETVVGRDKKDLEKFESKGTGYIGKHIVGTGEDAHLTTKVFFDLMRPHVMLITGKRGTGKCLTGDTLVTLDDGSQVPIRDLSNDSKFVACLGNNLKVSLAKKKGLMKRTVGRILKVKMRSGREIKLTPEHPLLTIGGWRDAKELGAGSRIAVPRKIDVFGKDVMEEHKIKILAYLVSKGYTGDFITFTSKDPMIMREFKQSVRLFDPTLVPKKHGENRFSFRVVKKARKFDGRGRLEKSSIRKWIDSVGLSNTVSREKFVPDSIFRLPRHQIALFLNRLFSGGGCVYKAKHGDKKSWEMSYSSESETLVRQVQHLLTRFEIQSKFREKRTRCRGKDFKSFELYVTGPNIIKFVNDVGFFGGKSRVQSRLLRESVETVRNPNVDTIPREIWDIYRPSNWAELGRRMGCATPKGMRSSINYSPSRQKLLRIAEIEGNDTLYQLATSDIFWDEIEEVEELTGSFDVYDMEVPGFHNFVANDIIVHNSYVAGVLVEETTMLPEEFRNNIATVIIDTMGIFWSMKFPNEQQMQLLDEWKLQPKAMENVKVYVPASQREDFEKSNVPVDFGISIAPYEFSAEDWLLAFNLSRTDPVGVALEKNINQLFEKGDRFSIDDIISKVSDDPDTADDVKNAVENMLTVASQWGVFSEEGANVDYMIQPGQVSVIDLSRLRSSQAWSVRNLIVALIARRVYQIRVVARKEEELAKITGEPLKHKQPMVWMVIDEAHNFVPSERDTVSSEPLKIISKQGREPGVSLTVITQMPNKVHQDILSQTDLVFSHRLTSRDDLQALHSVMQTYHSEDLWRYINSLPRWPGAAIILDDNLEKVFTVNIRPRLSWHAGGTAVIT